MIDFQLNDRIQFVMLNFHGNCINHKIYHSYDFIRIIVYFHLNGSLLSQSGLILAEVYTRVDSLLRLMTGPLDA